MNSDVLRQRTTAEKADFLLSTSLIYWLQKRHSPEHNIHKQSISEKIPRNFEEKANEMRGKVKDWWASAEYQVTPEKLTERLFEIIDISDQQERVKNIMKMMESIFEKGFTPFLQFQEALEKIDWYQLLVDKHIQEEKEETLSKEELLLPAQLNWDFFEAQKTMLQKNPESHDAFVQFTQERIQKKEKKAVERNLTGAGLPNRFPVVEKLAAQMDNYLSGVHNKFPIVVATLKEVVNELFDGQYEAFYTRGTASAFTNAINEYGKIHPNFHMISTSREYLPMLKKIKDDRLHLVDLLDTDTSEEDILEMFFQKGDEILMGKSEESRKNTPLVIDMSSVFRSGGVVDMKKITKGTQEKNEEIGWKQYPLWSDSSQDSRIILDADIVFYSKRHVGTNGGLMLINKKTYAEYNQLGNDAGGYDPHFLSLAINTLMSMKNKVAHSFTDILRTPEISYNRDTGKFVPDEIKKAKNYLQNSPILKDMFDFVAPDMMKEMKDDWRVDCVGHLIPKKQGVKLEEIVSTLTEEKEYIDFLFTDMPHKEKGLDHPEIYSPNELWGMLCNENIPIEEVQKKSTDFWRYYGSKMFQTLLPERESLTRKEAKQYFQEALRQNNILRFYINATHPEDYLLNFIKQLEKVVQKL